MDPESVDMVVETEAVQNFSTANADEPINLSNDRKFVLRNDP